MGLVYFLSENEPQTECTLYQLLQDLDLSPKNIFILKKGDISLVELCEQKEVSILLIQQRKTRKKDIQEGLNECRNLRIPYLFFKSEFKEFNIRKVLVSVGFLMEDYEKAQFASAFGRFCNTRITILQANDYGSKAADTVDNMKKLFDKFSLDYGVEKAKKDSFNLDKETICKAETEQYDIVLISASREYGLDDIIFGPPELHRIKKSSIPLLIVNPRDDLYTLCD
ncbi:MAG: hypothetical protein ACK5L7_08810 [Paludibacteraceae bacterium]